MKDVKRELGIAVLRQRRRQGWGPMYVARRANISYSHMNRIERGVEGASLLTLVDLAAVLECAIAFCPDGSVRAVPMRSEE